MTKDSFWSSHPADGMYPATLRLPSFGVGLLPSDPSRVVCPIGWGNHAVASDVGDAYSISYFWGSALAFRADGNFLGRAFLGSQLGYLRRLLLLILDQEEYSEIEYYHAQRAPGHRVREDLPEGQRPRLGDWVKVPPPEDLPVAQIRISDLRLANALRPRKLNEELRSLFGSLEFPLTSEYVLQWKGERVSESKSSKRPDLWSDEERRQEDDRIIAVSFAASALWLLLDLGAPRLQKAPREELLTAVLEIATLIRQLSEDLDKHAERLNDLMLSSRSGRPQNSGAKAYVALHYYRMGMPIRELSTRVGITPRHLVAGQSRGSKDWKKRLLNNYLCRGVEVEKEVFPSALKVFDRREDPAVQKEAIELYEDYLESVPELESQLEGSLLPGEDLLTYGREAKKAVRYRALVQLGACLINERDPFPTTLSRP